ncbi:hypothetical protein NFI96_024381 [Scomber scombrus]|uniref:Uncharacterized protein n=1 Tax=Scomber scombrus TaxID=13677 RepID=A0AAV1PZH1_SCOSC
MMACTVPSETGNNINEEVQRLIPLEETFMAQLDMHLSQLIRVVCAKGGATCQKTDIMNTLDQVSHLWHHMSSVDATDCRENSADLKKHELELKKT